MKGKRFGRHTLLTPLGRGGMGEVWAAQGTDALGRVRKAAVKLATFDVHDLDAEKRWIDELRLTSSLRHPNIVEVYEAGFEAGTPFLVMEYLQGVSLRDLFVSVRFGRASLPTSVLLRIIADAAQGLHAAHEAKNERGVPLHVVHRDVSPDNIFVTVSGVTKILDFGISRFSQQTSIRTEAGQFRGKADYSSPEQAFQQPLDRRSDVFSLASVLYEGLCGKPPHHRETVLATLQSLMFGEPVVCPADVDAKLADVLRQGLAHEAAERFPSVDQFALAIQEAALVSTVEEVASYLAKVPRVAPSADGSSTLVMTPTPPNKRRGRFLVKIGMWGTVVIATLATGVLLSRLSWQPTATEAELPSVAGHTSPEPADAVSAEAARPELPPLAREPAVPDADAATPTESRRKARRLTPPKKESTLPLNPYPR
jgi:eukaryotic-like serine/threonine-protein kinase